MEDKKIVQNGQIRPQLAISNVKVTYINSYQSKKTNLMVHSVSLFYTSDNRKPISFSLPLADGLPLPVVDTFIDCLCDCMSSGEYNSLFKDFQFIAKPIKILKYTKKN